MGLITLMADCVQNSPAKPGASDRLRRPGGREITRVPTANIPRCSHPKKWGVRHYGSTQVNIS